MNRLFETETTISLDGGEQDVSIRCHVEVGHGVAVGGGLGAVLDGDVPIADADRERIERALIACALEDDSDACALEDAGDRAREMERWS